MWAKRLLAMAIIGLGLLACATAAQAEPGAISIARAATDAPAHSPLQEAYQAYSDGNLTAARRAYEQALAVRPGERDALLGLAACAVEDNDLDLAMNLYARLARRHPQDALAQAALADLARRQGARQDEARLARLLSAAPDQPFLHFILGQARAAQARWPAAQQAFLEAYRADPANPVYALNLAISLDQGGLGDQALGYYYTALSLARDGGHELDTERVIARVNHLSWVVRP